MDRTLQIILALAAATASAAAQGVTPTPQAADTSSLVLSTAPAPSPVAPVAGQPASPGVSAEIASGLPGYRPEPTPKAGGAHADARDADKPRNQIVRLPLEVMRRYVVRERRLPVFRPLDLYTEKGLIDLSFKEHPGLRIGNFFNLNAPLAREMFIKEQLLAARDDLTDTAHAMAVGGDGSEGEAFQQAIIDESFEAGAGEGGPVGLK
jgi:hypothetical protein